jgi:carboxyl-terminal processing protease
MKYDECVKRRMFMAAVFLLLQGAHGQATQPLPVADYAKDLEFLLEELPDRAGHFFTAKGIDWPNVSAQFREDVKTVTSDAEHVVLCQRLMCRLRDGHAGLIDVKPAIPDESEGRRFTGPRVHLLKIGDRVYIRQAFGSAAQAGLSPGMEVVRIDDKPVIDWLHDAVTRLSDTRGYSTPQMAEYYAFHTGLADWAGTHIFIEVTTNGGQTIRLTRSGGSNFVPSALVISTLSHDRAQRSYRISG